MHVSQRDKELLTVVLMLIFKMAWLRRQSGISQKQADKCCSMLSLDGQMLWIWHSCHMLCDMQWTFTTLLLCLRKNLIFLRSEVDQAWTTIPLAVLCLHSKMHLSGSNLPKWPQRARLGLNLVPSPNYAWNINFVFNLSTGLVSWQFYCRFDNFFETIRYNALDLVTSAQWHFLAGLKKNARTKSWRNSWKHHFRRSHSIWVESFPWRRKWKPGFSSKSGTGFWEWYSSYLQS